MQINLTINIDDRLLNKIKNFFTKRNTVIAIFICILFVSALVYAGAIEKDWTFNTGDIIDAAKINDNFDKLFQQVNYLDGKTVSGAPTGTIVAFAGATVPNGWVLCNGATYDSKESDGTTDTIYAALNTVLGGRYGQDGTKFNVPDLSGRVVIGVNKMGGIGADVLTSHTADSLGDKVGNETYKLTTNQMPSHKHTYSDNYFLFSTIYGASSIKITSGDTVQPIGTSTTIDPEIETDATGGTDSFSLMQPSFAMYYIIKL